MEQQLVIIGNSFAAKECYWLAREVWGDALRFRGFLAFEGYRGNLGNLAGLELGDDDSHIPAADDVFVVGIASPALRLKAFAKWKERGARFANLIHPLARLPDDTVMGEANI
ncbi:MAG: transferase, partial [Deltaproteobacteria bacterium]|nr:transferase [Deltaproteobacteria bacterium]